MAHGEFTVLVETEFVTRESDGTVCTVTEVLGVDGALLGLRVGEMPHARDFLEGLD